MSSTLPCLSGIYSTTWQWARTRSDALAHRSGAITCTRARHAQAVGHVWSTVICFDFCLINRISMPSSSKLSLVNHTPSKPPALAMRRAAWKLAAPSSCTCRVEALCCSHQKILSIATRHHSKHRSPLSRRLGNRSVALSTALDSVAVDTRRATGHYAALTRLLATVVVDVFDVEGVNVSRDVSENRQADVDEEIYRAASVYASQG